MNSRPRPFPLKDTDWLALSAMVGLPDDARGEVEFILGWGRWLANHDKTSEPAHATRAHLARLQRQAQALRDACARPEVFMALTDLPERPPVGVSDPTRRTFGYPTRLTSARKLEQHTEALAELAAWLKHAADRIPKDKRGNKTAATDFMTEAVDGLLLRHTARRLTTGVKEPDPGREFLRKCVNLIGVKGKLDSMIRKLPAKRRCKVSAEKT